MVSALEDPRIRVLLELKREIDEEYERLTKRLEMLRAYRQALDTVIGVRSFATADAALASSAPTGAQGPAAQPSTEERQTIDVYNKGRSLLLAQMIVDGANITIIPAEHALYDIKRGAFARFFVERILGKFQQEDRHRVENGEIGWEQAFDFEVKDEDGHLKEIVIRNYGSEARLQEIQRALRWALEKIYTPR